MTDALEKLILYEPPLGFLVAPPGYTVGTSTSRKRSGSQTYSRFARSSRGIVSAAAGVPATPAGSASGRPGPRGALTAALPDCRVVVMPGQSHTAIDTGTDLFTSEVLSFLAPSY